MTAADERNQLVEGLLREKFGKWYDWTKPVLLHTIGPNDPTAYDQLDDRRNAEIASARKALIELSDDKLALLSSPSSGLSDTLTAWFVGWLSNAILGLDKLEPPWPKLGFGHPEVAADFQYWGQFARYSLHETIMLSLGMEPTTFSEQLVKGTATLLDPSKTNPQFYYLGRRLRLIRGYFPTGYSGYASVSAQRLKRLVDEISLEIPDEFYRKLEARIAPVPVEIPAQPETLTTQEKRSLLSLIAAMACEQYGFDPKVGRSSVTPSIREDLDRVGLSMDEKTVRKWVREATELVAEDYWKS